VIADIGGVGCYPLVAIASYAVASGLVLRSPHINPRRRRKMGDGRDLLAYFFLFTIIGVIIGILLSMLVVILGIS